MSYKECLPLNADRDAWAKNPSAALRAKDEGKDATQHLRAQEQRWSPSSQTGAANLKGNPQIKRETRVS